MLIPIDKKNVEQMAVEYGTWMELYVDKKEKEYNLIVQSRNPKKPIKHILSFATEALYKKFRNLSNKMHYRLDECAD